MKNFDNFDDLIKKKMDGMDFPFNESNWEKASQMLDASRPSKKPLGKFWITTSVIGGCLLIVGITALLWMNQSDDNKIVSSSTSQKSTNEHHENKAPGIEQLNTTTSENTNTSDINTLAEPTENSTITDVKNTDGIANQIKPTRSQKAQQIASLPIQKPIASSVNEPKQTLNEEAKANNTTLETPVDHVSESNQALVGSVENAKLKDKEANERKNVIENTSKTNTSVYKPLESFSTAAINPNNNNTDQSALENNIPTNANSAAKQDSVATAAVTPLQPDTTTNDAKRKDYVKTKHHEITIEGGVMNSFGWKVNNIRNGNNLSPIGGINYLYHFDHRSALSVGLQYNSLSNLTESNVSYSVTSYDFGVNNDVTTYKVIGLQYLVMPVRYIYHINKDNSLGVGVNGMYLMNIKNKIESFTAVENNVKNTSIVSDNGYGYNVVNNYNAQIAINYQRKLSKQLGFNIEVNRNLMNVFNNYTFFGSECRTSKPITAKISLTYTLLRK